MINRILERIIYSHLDKGKIIHIPGPRQVGKTTLLKKIEKETKLRSLWLNGDEAEVREMLSDKSSNLINS